MPIIKQARFLVLEGLDGAGTTTQAAGLAEALRARDLRVHLTAEPSDGPLGRVARAHVKGEITLDARTAALAFSADRADHLARTIRPALESGEWVVCDRYLLSTLAYQGAGGVDPAWIMEVSRGFDAPDLTVFLDLPHDARFERMAGRGVRERYEDPALADPIRDAYLASIDRLRAAGHRIRVVDANADLEEVLLRILGAVDRLDASDRPVGDR